MRPSSFITFEPGLEHGVPWGRDLFTFVTSAAGHMMRTLQRPRKNKPSKRQVNHRRFLHNMIHRKFAEIEAANHQLASVLFSTDKLQGHLTAKPSVTNDISDQQSKNATDTSINTDKPKVPVEQQEDVCDLWTLDTLMDTQMTDKSFLQLKQVNNTATNPRTEESSNGNNRMIINSGMEKDTYTEKQQASTDVESLTSSLLEDSMSTQIGSTEKMRTNSKPFITKCSDVTLQHRGNDVPDPSPPSPVISLLSLDSCDLEIQMLIDADHTAQTQDSLQMDMVDSFDLYCCDNQDVQIYDPKCKTAELTGHNDEDQLCLDSGCDMDHLTSSIACLSPQEFEYDSQINPIGNSNLDPKGQELSVFDSQASRQFHHDQVNYYISQNNIPEDHMRQFTPCMMTNTKDAGYLALSVSNQISDCIGSSHILDHCVFQELENELECESIRIHNWQQQSGKSTYKSYSHSLEDLMPQDEIITQNRTGFGLNSTIMDGSCFESFYDKGESWSYCEFRGNSHNFEGVARSFPATVHKTHPAPIPTPPLDDDWLFSNIVTEVKSMTMDY